MERHVPGGALTQGKSLFNATESIRDLITAAEQVAPTLQRGGNLQRVVDAGRNIGFDRASQQATSMYTVITSKAGELVTAFPGVPGRP